MFFIVSSEKHQEKSPQNRDFAQCAVAHFVIHSLVHDSPVSVAELEVIPAAVVPVEAAVLALGSRGIHVLQVVILEMSA